MVFAQDYPRVSRALGTGERRDRAGTGGHSVVLRCLEAEDPSEIER